MSVLTAPHILILDFGSQYTQLIARRIRELEVFVEVLPFSTSMEKIKALKPKGVILSGGPFSVYQTKAPALDVKQLLEKSPILGICYGMQLICHQLGGVVSETSQREYGFHRITSQDALLKNIPNVWMSHGDIIEKEPKGFEILARSHSRHIAAVQSDKFQNPILAVQFHPEVSHTQNGMDILKHFVFDICQSDKNWKLQDQRQLAKEEIQAQVSKEDKVLCALSGGVDSTVSMALLCEALGPEKVYGVFVNTGFLRKNEVSDVLESYKKSGFQVEVVHAEQEFLKNLKSVVEPEEKRKIIGKIFIETFEKYMDSHLKSHTRWLAQGTLYTDRIESVPVYGSKLYDKKSS